VEWSCQHAAGIGSCGDRSLPPRSGWSASLVEGGRLGDLGMAQVTKGNVFEDLGFDPEQAADLAMKVDLASDLGKFIERQGLTHAPAAEFLGVHRPKVSHIQTNKLGGISIEHLVRMLAKTGGKLSYRFRQPSKQVASAAPRKDLVA
jgi:predicted XRE-type DNA-binding protein